MHNEVYQNETKRTCATVSTTACNRMPCTYIGTRNITPLDNLSTVTAPSSSPSLSISPSGSSRTAPLSSTGLCPPTEVPSYPWTGSPPMDTSMFVPTRVPPPPLRTPPEDPYPRWHLADSLTTRGSLRVHSPSSADSTWRPDPTAEPFFQSGNLGDAYPLSWMNLWVLTHSFLPAPSLRIPSTRRGFNCRAGALLRGSPTPQLPKGDCPSVPPPSLFSIWEVIPLYLLPPLPPIPWGLVYWH